jgi:hypothetical protein
MTAQRTRAPSLSPSHTLGAELERDRLERRLRLMTVAISVLRQRERESQRERGAPRRHLGHAIADFEVQIEAMNTRLRDLAIDSSSIQAHRDARGVERVRRIAT